MTNVYLVDLENVHQGGLQNASYLSKEDELIIFYSKNASINSAGVVKALKGCKAKITNIEVYLCGKDSLDFQLVTHLGTMVSDGKDKTFYIISKDKEYVSVTLFLKELIDVYLIPKILIDKNNKVINSTVTKTTTKVVTKTTTKTTKVKTKSNQGASSSLKDAIVKIAKLRKMDKSKISNIIEISNTLEEYNKQLKKVYTMKGASFYEETIHIFNKLKGINSTKVSSAEEKMKKIILENNLEIVDIYGLVKSSQSLSKYYGKLGELYGKKGETIYKETVELFYGVKYGKL